MATPKNANPTALITGATAGIGESFSRLLARKGYNLILVARDLARLKERKRELNQKHPDLLIETLRADLTVESDIATVESRVSQGIDLLINNAGFGINKSFTRSSLVSERELLSVLVEVPMRLAHQAIPAMLEKKNGLIINVSSVAAFIAGGTYSAAKSYLTILSESLHSELKSEGVKVLALCPGFTRTEFHQRGRMRMTGLPSFLWLSADFVTEVAWRDLHRGKAISVPGWQYKLLMGLIRSLPRPLVRRNGLRVKSKQRRD
jgi:short-subunit dehydrogenase